MAYVITDLNDFEIQISDGFRDIIIWKQNIRFGAIVGNDLTLYWHNKAQTDTQYQLTIDWNDVSAPVVASAAALQSAIEAMIISGWGGGGSGISLSAGGVTVSNGTVVFSNANSVTFGMAGSTVTASVSTPAQSEYFFSNANGVSFGTAGSTVTASHNGITSQSVQTQNSVQVQGSTGNISFANSNGITFGGNASTITASYTVPTVTNSSWTASAGTQSATVSQLVFSNSNGVSFGLDSGTITGSHNGLTVQSSQPINFSVSAASTISATSGSGYNFSISGVGDLAAGITGNTIILSHAKNFHTFSANNGSYDYENLYAFDANGVSFLTTVSGGSSGFVASHNGITSQSIQTQNAVSVLGSTGNISFANSNGITFGGNASTITASHNGLTSQSNQALSGSNGSFTFQTATFGNLNGVSFYTSNGSLVASHNGITSQSVQPVAVSGSNGSFSFSTVTFGNLNGASFYTSNGSVVMSYTVPAAGGALSFSAGTSSGTFNSLVFSNSNSVSFGLDGSTVTASFNAGAGADITLSMWPERVPTMTPLATTNSGTNGATGGSTQITASYYIASVQFPHPVAFSNIFGVNCISTTVAGTGSVTIGHGIGIYSLNANTAMSLVSSFQWQDYVSQNSVTAVTHRFFWGSNSTTNSSQLSGNISASFTAPNGSGRRIVMYQDNATLDRGNYYIASVYTASSAGVNVFQCASQAMMDSNSPVTPIGSLFGQSNISRFVGWNGVFSSTSNKSRMDVPIMPSSIHTSVITISASTLATQTFRNPYLIFERSIT